MRGLTFFAIFFLGFGWMVQCGHSAIENANRRNHQDFVRTFGQSATLQTITEQVARHGAACNAARLEEGGFWRAALAGNPYVVVQEDPLVQRERIRYMFKDRIAELEKKTSDTCRLYHWESDLARRNGINAQ